MRLIALSAALLFSAAVRAGMIMTQEEALRRNFPGASVERRTLYLDEAQAAEVRARARAPVESRVVTYYAAASSGAVAGYAYFDTHTVRTMPETFMAVLAPDGSLKSVELLAFYEPEDYRPPRRWLDLFAGRKLDDDLKVKRGIRHITGATLTAQAITDGVRRVLAVHEVAVKEKR